MIENKVRELERRIKRLESQAINTANGDWINVTSFSNGWAQYSSASAFQVRYRKLAGGLVQIAGLADPSSATSSGVFTLPEGYRPSQNVYQPGLQSGTTPKTYFVQSSGLVTFNYSGTGFCSLHAVFLAEQ